MGNIKNYVYAEIISDPLMRQYIWSDPTGAARIIRTLASKADRVFLWDVLTCRFVLEGPRANHRIEELYS